MEHHPLLLSLIAGLAIATPFERASGAPTLLKPSKPITTVSPLRTNLRITMPTLTQLRPTSCVKPGDKITLIGRNFGKFNQHGIAIAGAGMHIDLKPIKWTQEKILVQLPNNQKFIAGEKYPLGFEKANHGQWLNNRALSVTICKTASQARIPQTGFATRGQQAMAYAETTATETTAEESYSSESYGQETPFVPSSGGSLLSSGMPAPPSPPGLSPDEEAADIEPGEIIILSADMDDARAVAAELSAVNITVKRRRKLKSLGMVISTFRIPPGEVVSHHLKRLRDQYSQLWVEANHRYQVQSVSPTRWEHKSIGWKTVPGCGKGIRIGQIDTPVNVAHQMLANGKITTRSFIPRGVAPASADHGTAIASQLVGLMPETELIAAEVFKQQGKKHIGTSAELLIMSLDWMVEQRVSVINLSLGGKRNLLLEATLNRVMALGISTVAAAGNNGAKAPSVYPAAQPGVIAVTALDAEAGGYTFANQGTYVDFAAPGVDVAVAKADGGMVYRSGTSHAAPFVTVAMANIRRHHKGNSKQYYERLKKSAQDLGNTGHDTQFGWGLINTKEICGQ